MPKFFVTDDCIKNNKITISGKDFNHIKNVLRLKLGNTIIISNARDHEFEVKINSFENNAVETEILREIKRSNEPSVNISLFQGIPKGDKMDMIIQKAVEIGAAKIIPLMTSRVVVKLDEGNAKKKMERWQKVSEHAAKQCGRNIIPEVTKPIAYSESLNVLRDYDLVVVLYENEKNKTLKEVLRGLKNKPKNIAVLIGPEGGFSENEIELVKEFNIISLGPRILRTETAGIVSTAIILYEMGDIS